MADTSGPKVKCRLCGVVIQSTYRHDFVWCKCGSIAIDGGADYTKVTGKIENIDWMEGE